MDTQTEPLLRVTNLSIGTSDDVQLVEDVSFQVMRGETLAIVGESGCGKSLTSLAIIGLLPDVLAKRVKGQVVFETTDLLDASEKALGNVRGKDIAMVFQDALSALNPLMTVGQQIAEGLIRHGAIPKENVRERVLDLLNMVRIPDPAARIDAYPHELSGGMRQRVVIAMAMSCEPKLILADEPTTALDVTVQAQILDIIRDIQQRANLALVLVTHDLGVVRTMARRMVVMYAGSVVEAGSVDEILHAPQHPYTTGLMQARPHGSYRRDGQLLRDIQGVVPSPAERPIGCRFSPRCDRTTERCCTEIPQLVGSNTGHQIRCFHPILG
jgi:oligopeptide/dipeptide ABC transporter ATP-binding protein